jgi:hypothetical protein
MNTVLALSCLTTHYTKKELPVLEHRSRGHVPLISHHYDDLSAAYLGTVVLD